MIDDLKRIRGECLGFRARMMGRVITSVYDDALAHAGLKVSQFSLLAAIAMEETTRPSELAKLMQMDESTLSRNVDRMCARGWLRLDPDTDRRSHFIRITDKGAALLKKSLPAWQRAQTEIARRLGEDGVAALKSVARKLRA